MSNSNYTIDSRVENMPIRYIMIYLVFTQIAYILMYHGQYPNIVVTILFTSLCYVSLYMGNLPGWKIKDSLKTYNYNDSIKRIIVFCAISTIIISLYNVFSFYSDITIIKQLILNPGQAYEYVKFIRRNGDLNSTSAWESIIGIILNIFTFTKYFLGGFSIMYWKNLTKGYKSLIILSIIVYTVHSLLMGAMVNVGSFFLSICPFLLFKIKNRNKRASVKSIAFLMIIVIIFTLAILYFLGTRKVFQLNYSDTGVLMSGLLGLLFYISHGYVGLSYCLDLPFKFTWGHTVFRGISTTILPYFGINNAFFNSYLVRNEVENGWSALQVWSTVFPWLASDITFWLIPVLMFIIGYFMKKLWKESLVFENPYALAVLGQLFIFCFMIPANNQLFHTFGNSVGTIVIYIFYFNSRYSKLSSKIRR
ncbi:hypothetical protein [Clostridium tunisiense]|uniref:hypothetical protein n=1 Tax=Clostridium tunisiense TaxID=219748 RepID=UPI000310A3D4|nr:hypothetical protein [Clostridium tunisiense]